MPRTGRNPVDCIVPLEIDGLKGRQMIVPAGAGRKREVLFIYGQHSSLERWAGFAEALSEYGGVTIPDLPGFGGMTSLYEIGKTADVDTLADYLADYIKLRYGESKFVLTAMSLGFVIATRMLQRHPELTRQVSMLVSVVGFAHHDDFVFNALRYRLYRHGAALFTGRISSRLFRELFLRPGYLRRVYAHSLNAKEKFKNLSGDEFSRTMEMELHLWKINDIRTQMKTNVEMLTLNNCDRRIDLPLWYVAAKHDRYFNNKRAARHLRQIFREVHIAYTAVPNHAPTIIADAKTAAPFIPQEVREAFLALG